MSNLRYPGETTDIRAWLNANRPELVANPRGKLKNEAIAAYREAHDEAVPEQEETAAVPEPPAEVEPERAGEAKRPWLRRKLTPAKTDARPKRRVSIDGVMSAAWMGLSHLFSRPETLPVGRCLAIQAPAAGMMLDEALRGSVVDRLLQPVARAGKRGEAVWAIAGPPVLVGAITQRPELYPVLRPMLRQAFSTWVLMAGPKIRKAQEREAKLLAELDGDFTAIDAMIDSLFAPMEVPDAAYAASEAASA